MLQTNNTQHVIDSHNGWQLKLNCWSVAFLLSNDPCTWPGRLSQAIKKRSLGLLWIHWVSCPSSLEVCILCEARVYQGGRTVGSSTRYRYLRRILRIRWQDHVSTKELLEKAGMKPRLVDGNWLVIFLGKIVIMIAMLLWAGRQKVKREGED